MKPGWTSLSHKEGLIISNGSEKIKNVHVLSREPSSKKMLYAIFFNSSGPVVQVPCLSGHKYTSRSSLGSAIYQCLQRYQNKNIYLLFATGYKGYKNVFQ